MLKRVLVAIAALLVLVTICVVAGLLWAHAAIRRERAPLPSFNDVLAAPSDGGPVRVWYINTASQEMPRSGVLDPKKDPWPQQRYVMSHPSFGLEWADGRILLVDVGMTRSGAKQFGEPIEKVIGGQAIVPHGSVAERLGNARLHVAGAVFTHLHLDHVGGITDLCANKAPIRVFMTPAQAQRPNYLTRSGLNLVRDSGCAQLQELPSTALAPLPGFPGVTVIAAGGHTPGSQIIIAAITGNQGVRRIAFIGDLANNIDGITYNVPKPLYYSLLVVPEDRTRLDELRRWLRELRDAHGVQLLTAHDQIDLERSGIAAWVGAAQP